MLLPVAHSGVVIEGTHPKLRQRAAALFSDPRVAGKVVIVSGLRPVGAEGDLDAGRINTSWYFWEGYQLRLAEERNDIPPAERQYSHFNLAAYPGRSKHNERQTPEGLFGLAYDLRIAGGGLSWTTIHAVAPQYGLGFPLADVSRFGRWAEPWHMTGTKPGSLTDWYRIEGQSRVFGGFRVTSAIASAARQRAPHQPELSPVEQIKHAQTVLGTPPDGIIGPATRKAAEHGVNRAGNLRDAAGVIRKLDRG